MGTTGSKKRNEKIFDRNQKHKKPNNLTNVQQQQQQEEVISDEWVQQQFHLQHQNQEQQQKQQIHQQHQSTIHQVEGKENEVEGKSIEEEAVTPKDQQIKPETTKTTLTAESPAAIVIRTKANSTPSSSIFAAKSTPALASASDSTQSQRLKQNSSTWSLNSLLGTRLSWSFSGRSRSSFRHRNKSGRKSFTSLPAHQVESTHQYQEQRRSGDYHYYQQQQSTRQKHQQQLIEDKQKRSKTLWHKPITNAIFSSHFKESSHSIEKYQIEKLVAKGAFGIVFQVTEKQQQHSQATEQGGSQATLPTTTSTPTATAAIATSSKKATAESYQKPTFKALKVLKKSKIIADNSVQQIKDEADIQKICGHHPFIVQQFDLWQNRHNLFIISEYMPNGELFSKIRDFSLDLVRLYLAEIALALDFLHNAGIIYRDAKPENILLTDKYHIKLTDFGLSKWLKLGMTTKTICGTFHYMGTIY